jgi:YidC/Oxa1 family membrane protein insertase
MRLYQENRVNPFASCLPLLLQMPVFFALYYTIRGTSYLPVAETQALFNASFLWLPKLGEPDPYYILPLLMAGSMIIQTRLNPTPPDPLQAKMMMWMPLIFSVMFFFFPAGLVLYWVVNNLFSIAQQWVITRRIEGKPVFGKA